MGMQVIGQAWVERCLRTSWTICFMFQEVETDLLCIRAKQIGVFIDPDTLNPTRVPPAIVARVANTNQQ
jgi:acyl-CoA thioesterase FadM